MLCLWLLLLTLLTLLADWAELRRLDRTHGGALSTAVQQAEGRRPPPDVLVDCAVCMGQARGQHEVVTTTMRSRRGEGTQNAADLE